jgi:hypothetical protein
MVTSRHTPPSLGDFLDKKRTGAERAGRRWSRGDRFNPAGQHARPRGGRSRYRAHARGEGGSLWDTHVRFRGHQSRGVGAAGNNILTVPPEVAEGSTEA